jgi:NADP-reducing hydrogenase subunit HndA
MLNSKTKIAFQGTKEQEKELMAVIKRHGEDPGALMPVLQEAQEIYGYLPYEVQNIIARELKISLEEVYGVATFYSQFSLNPKGKYKVSVCLGTACYVKGSGDINEKVKQILGISDGDCTEDGLFSIEACRCVGACGLAPVMMINDEVYGRLTPDDVETILNKYRD